MTKREELIKKIMQQGDPTGPDTPSPVVTLEDFFEENDDLGSIGCNLTDHPGTDGFYNVLRDVRSRADVQDVLVEIYEIMEGDDEWPFAERVYIITSADSDDVCGWLTSLDPSEIEEGWVGEAPPAAPAIQPGMRVLAAWWD